jgi:hypothetical protein
MAQRTDSASDLYVTDALAARPYMGRERLPGRAHEGMTTVPETYAKTVSRFPLSGSGVRPPDSDLRLWIHEQEVVKEI